MVCALLAALCVRAAAQIDYTGTLVRLHVVAEDDTPQAQEIKLAVRDACLACAGEYLADCSSSDEAYAALEDHLDDFRAAAARAAEDMGWSGEITAEAGVFAFPDRLYGSLRVPAGEYRALRVTLGAGEGHNWWCVLYPSLCGLDEAEYAAPDEPVKFYSSIWRWLRALFGGDGE